ncbi:MAG: ribulose-phosphate 3-epimerase [archaeon]
MVKVSASVLSRNFSQEAVDAVKSADMLQLDIMDGEFVPHRTIWADSIDFIKTDLIKDVHLMIMRPEEHVEDFMDSGADRIAFHVEATDVPQAVIGLIQGRGIKAGIAINPETPLENILPFLEEVDFVLVMTVNPGASGGGFIDEALNKVRLIRKNFPNLEIEVDGGIDSETAKLAVNAGADIVVSDTYINVDPEERIRILKDIN